MFAAAAAGQSINDAQIASIVVTANQVDIDAGKLAQSTSANAEVKKFAERMITDHTGVNKSAVELVTKLKVTPEDNPTSQSLKSGGESNLAHLKTLKGAAFDNAYIDESWGLLQTNLAAFESNPRNLDAFAHAAHGIADLYAHTTYLHWAPLVDADPETGYAEPYDHATMALDPARDYMSGKLNLLSSRYTVNRKYFRGRGKDQGKIRAIVQKRWQGRLISGRYAQPGGGLLGWATGDIGPGGIKHQAPEVISTIPDALKGAAGFSELGALPHHNEIAIDAFPKEMSASDFKMHKLYTKTGYGPQFQWRYNTACRHILKEFVGRWKP